MLTLGQAARLTGLGKTTITRAIKAGRLSATRRDDGSYEIDPAELHRVYSIRPETPETVAQSGHAVRDATPSERPRDGGGDPVTVRLATLEAEVQGLTALLDEVKASREELRRDRDAWRHQAQTLALIDQTKPGASATVPSVVLEPRRPWWRRLYEGVG
jgi:excisionase family DNA binding protein